METVVVNKEEYLELLKISMLAIEACQSGAIEEIYLSLIREHVDAYLKLKGSL